jgi:hypothetical protein
MLLLLGSACLTGLACSTSDDGHAASLEAAEILELINEGRDENDPRGDIEVDLGKFRVTHAVGDEEEVLLLVDFQLIAVLSGQKQAALEAALPAYSNRLRDMVISLLQSVDTEHLTDPSLAYLRAELIAGINRVLQQRLVKDVAFSNFSVHDAHLAPFPTTTTSDAKPKKSGHGGHGGGHGH